MELSGLFTLYSMKMHRAFSFSALPALLLGVGLVFTACDDGSKDDKIPDYDGPPVQYSCINPGNHCLTTIDCCGGSTCQNNFCAGSGLKPGQHCRSSSDCAGASVCAGDVCTATDAQACVKPGNHCDTSGDCCGGSTCSGGFCRSGGSLSRGAHCETSADCSGVLTCVPFGSGPKACY